MEAGFPGQAATGGRDHSCQERPPKQGLLYSQGPSRGPEGQDALAPGPPEDSGVSSQELASGAQGQQCSSDPGHGPPVSIRLLDSTGRDPSG